MSLITIVPMMLGVAVAEHTDVGQVAFLVALVLTVVLGAWLTGPWIIADLQLAHLHPAYFLPTKAGGLIASAGSAALGYETLARAMCGYGVICWMVLGPILILRLFAQPMLPLPLVPTIATQVAPPVVAGNAWFEMNGNRVDAVALTAC